VAACEIHLASVLFAEARVKNNTRLGGGNSRGLKIIVTTSHVGISVSVKICEPFLPGVEASEASRDAGFDSLADIARPVH